MLEAAFYKIEIKVEGESLKKKGESIPFNFDPLPFDFKSAL